MSVQVVESEDPLEQNKTLQFRLIRSLEDISIDENVTHNCALEVSQRYGVTFILFNGNLRIIEAKTLLEDGVTLPPPVKSNVNVIGLSADDSLLAVGSGSNVCIYETKSFCQQPSAASPRCSFIVSKSQAATSQLAWNPTELRLIAALGQDGTVLLVRILDNWSVEVVNNTDSSFRCMSWSPKGKQLVVAGANAVVQLKLDLKEAKKIPLAPGVEPVSICWLSTLQFLVSFQPPSRDDLKIMLLTLSKTAPPMYKDFGDVFLSDDFTNTRVLSKHIPLWKIHTLGSSTSSDIIAVTHDPSQPTSDIVVQEIEDRFRAALPLDHFCRGSALYLGLHEPLVVGGEQLQGSSFLILLSQKGLVTIFRIINEGAPPVHVPTPEPLKLNNVVSSMSSNMNTPAPAFGTIPSAAPATTTSLFGNLNLPQANLFGIGASTVSSGITGTNSVASTIFGSSISTGTSFLGMNKSVAGVPPTSIGPDSIPSANILDAAPVVKNLFGSPAAANAPAAGVQPNQFLGNIKTSGSSLLGHPPSSVVSSSGGAGDASSIIPPQTIEKVPTKTPAMAPEKALVKSEDHLHLLQQLKQFQIRYTNFKKMAQQQAHMHSASVNQYFAQLDAHILKDLHKISDFAKDIVETTNGQKEEIDGLFMNMQNLFTKIEYGLIAAEKSRDSKYLRLLRAQPIDPMSMAKLAKVEKSFTYVKNQLKEARRYFHLQEQNLRPLDGTISVNFIYQTLANHRHIIQNLSRQSLELRQKLQDHNIQLVASMGSSSVTLDDIVSGISTLKLKPSREDQNGLLAKQVVVYKKGKVDQLRRWAGHTVITRVPVTGAVDPYLPIAQMRKIRLNAEAEEIETQSTGSHTSATFVATATNNVVLNATEASKFSTALSINPSDTVQKSSNLEYSPVSLTSSPVQTSPISLIAATSSGSLVSTVPNVSGGQAVSSSTSLPAFSFGTLSSSSSFFGSQPMVPTTTKSLFGGLPSSVPTLSTSNQTSASSTFSFTGLSQTSSSTSSATPPAAPAFSFASATSTSSSFFGGKPLFGTTPSTSLPQSTVAASTTSMFGSQLFKSTAVTTTITSLTGSLPSATIFGSTTSSAIFGATKTTTDGTTSTLFGVTKPTESSSFFSGSVAAAKLSESAIGGSVPQTTASLFGAPLSASSPTTTGSLFSGIKQDSASIRADAITSLASAASVPTATSLLDSKPNITTSATFVQQSTVSTSSSIFGSTPLFGSTVGAPGSIFGSSGLFGSVTTTSATISTDSSLAGGMSQKSSSQAKSAAVSVELKSGVTITPIMATVAPSTTTAGAPLLLGSLVPSLPSSATDQISIEPVSRDQQQQQSSEVPAEAVATKSEDIKKEDGTSSLFGSLSLAKTAPSTASEAKSASSIFGGVSSATPATATVFGTPAVTPSATPSIFGASSASSPLVAEAPATQTKSIFGAAATTTTAAATSIFGTAPTSSIGASGSLFGVTTTATTAAGDRIFGAVTTSTGVAGSLFGSPSAATTSAGSLFGAAPVAATTTSASLFGSSSIFGSTPATSTPASSSLFGAPAAGSSIFGTPAASAQTGSIFGTPGATKPATSIFGASTTAGTGGSLFGSTATTAAAIFGGGAAKPTEAAPSAIFGGGGSSVFGGGTATDGKQIFGSPSTQQITGGQQQQSVFGSPAFGSGNTVGAFGQAGGTTGGFGSPPVFGGTSGGGLLKPATGSFGLSHGATGSVFGGSSPQATTATPAFGSQGAPAFGGGAVFGGGTGFGTPLKPSSFTSSNIFGGGGSASGGSTFGALAGSGNQAQSPTFGSPGFGSPQQTQQQAAFGAAPAFGGAPVFGSQAPQQQQQPANVFGSSAFAAGGSTSGFGQQSTSPSFGGGAVFGGSPAFGSSGKSFGVSNSSTIFGGGGTVDNSNASFGNIAQNQNQPAFGSQSPGGGFGSPQTQPAFGSFGAFGQQQQQPQQSQNQSAFGGPAFGGGGGFGQPQQQQQQQAQAPASFGGTSFSSWR